MILKLNHVRAKAVPTAQAVIESLYKLLEEGCIDQDQFARLHVELDWIQYKQNFRETVSTTQGATRRAEPGPIMGVHVNTRDVDPEKLRDDLLRVITRARMPSPQRDEDRIVLEDFRTMRTSIVWEFNKVYWMRLHDWQEATGKGYEEALPGGVSDGHQPEAIADSVGDFWSLLRDLDAKGHLPPEVYMLEIGVGAGTRCALWLTMFRELDRERGTNYYPKLRMLLGDYSDDTLDLSRPAVKDHLDQCTFLVMDAINPLKTIPHLRHKVLQVHLTNVYDNLPDEEIVRRDGQVYFVQVRAYIPMVDAIRLSTAHDVPLGKIRDVVARLLGGDGNFLGDRSRGLTFWQDLWAAMKLEERLVRLEDLDEYPFPEGLDAAKFEDILNERQAPSDFRMHLSSGALESFVRTLPLLHTRGYLQVLDIFVTDLLQYRLGFFGPGKLDGSLLNWVNGALLKEVAERSGYDVHFSPFHYRKGSRTSILYTTRRE